MICSPVRRTDNIADLCPQGVKFCHLFLFDPIHAWWIIFNKGVAIDPTCVHKGRLERT